MIFSKSKATLKIYRKIVWLNLKNIYIDENVKIIIKNKPNFSTNIKQNIFKLKYLSDGHAFIVPQEIPSILSLVYSNIPPIKKGK